MQNVERDKRLETEFLKSWLRHDEEIRQLMTQLVDREKQLARENEMQQRTIQTLDERIRELEITQVGYTPVCFLGASAYARAVSTFSIRNLFY
jgi:uncharacterized membrane protein YccC